MVTASLSSLETFEMNVRSMIDVYMMEENILVYFIIHNSIYILGDLTVGTKMTL